jgi:hypothetical protein
MMRDPFAYEAEYGWIFRIDTDLDASSVNTREIELVSPAGVVSRQTATAVTTDAAGDFQFTVASGTFTKGSWTAQVVLTWTATKELRGKVHRFNIGASPTAP